ncbi:hypothetical protein B0J13DRAFT_402967, partial [Dactylonectria estremocensis]
IAGAATSWWDAEVPHPALHGVAPNATSSPLQDASEREDRTAESSANESSNDATSQSKDKAPCGPTFSGSYIYEHYYMQPLDKILRPFFFASIGFSILITEMFRGPIVWKGIVYAVLMLISKLLCGLWLIRISFTPRLPTNLPIVLKFSKLKMTPYTGEPREKQISPPNTDPAESSQSQKSSRPSSRPAAEAQTRSRHTEPAGVKPRSIYPASIIGCAMVARGENGFLISSIAESKGVFESSSSDSGESSDMLLVVTWAIVLCTILGPLAVGLLVRRVKQLQQGVGKQGRVVQGDVLGVWGLS